MNYTELQLDKELMWVGEGILQMTNYHILHFALNTFPQPADRDQPDARNLRHLCAQLCPGLLCGLPHRGKGVQGDSGCKRTVSIFGIYELSETILGIYKIGETSPLCERGPSCHLLDCRNFVGLCSLSCHCNPLRLHLSCVWRTSVRVRKEHWILGPSPLPLWVEVWI